MYTQPAPRPDQTGQMDDWHDLVQRRAHELRREAIRDFWRGADAMVAATAAQAGRSARRLAQRLARHTRGQAESGESLCTSGKGV